MYFGMSTTDTDSAFVPKNRRYFCFFFIAFVIVGAFFTLNLFVGIVISTFNREKENIGKDFLLTKNQKTWLETKLIIFR